MDFYQVSRTAQAKGIESRNSRSIFALFRLHDTFPRSSLGLLLFISTRDCAGADITITFNRRSYSLIKSFELRVAAEFALILPQVLVKCDFEVGFQEIVKSARKQGLSANELAVML